MFDGGLSENLGLAEVVRALEVLKVSPDDTELAAFRRARKVVVIAVNALRFPVVDWDTSDAPADATKPDAPPAAAKSEAAPADAATAN